ncbi:MAG: ATP-binding protein [Nitrososphaerales archaeon]
MLGNVHEIDQATYAQVLDFNIQTCKNLIVLGMAGTGKTEMAFQACDRSGYEFKYLDLSVLEAPDLIGLPIIVEGSHNDKVVDYATPKFLPREDPNIKPYVLVVDEIDKTKPELQNPLLELFQLHSINGNKMGIQAIIATGNLPEEGAFSQPISHALTNRCKVFKLTHSFDVWREWAQEANVNPLVIGFLSKHQDYLCMPAIEGDPTAYCRPSPRSWTEAARELNFTDPKKHSVDFQSMLVAGRVGTAAAVKFRTWLEFYRHVEPLVDELWEKGKAPPMNDMTIDKQLVCAISAVDMVAQACRRQPKTPADKQKQMDEVQKGAKNVFSWVKQLQGEFQIGAVKSTLNMKLIQDFNLTKIPEVMQTYLNVRKAMKD